eukprot:CAMPEP_0119376524 /NCGR_PEP_ID=MMETSP1334-20130426/40125_1 /TAXON_ID=127549 /ORGANISM="Calcidiscus leptoporus, Strain RCC1130" /LENGTH=80 /DNA_ID=CAMNT_0007395093 /DNA_START=14 /DNA_END=252 /DNA_ORIENTATION=-
MRAHLTRIQEWQRFSRAPLAFAWRGLPFAWRGLAKKAAAKKKDVVAEKSTPATVSADFVNGLNIMKDGSEVPVRKDEEYP